MHNLVTAGQTEYRTLWYEQTEYHISEFDQKDEVRVVWRPDGGARATPYATSGGGTSGGGSVDTSGTNMSIADGTEEDKKAGENDKDMVTKTVGHATNGDGSRSFSVLVPMMSKYADVMDQVRQKLCINPEVDIRMFEVKNSKICKFTNPGESVPPIMTGSHDCGAELRAEPVPADETEEALGLDYELIRVLHLAKDKKSRAYRGLQFFGVPFVIKVKKDGEPVGAIRRRIQQKLGVPFEEFDEWPLAEIVQLKVVYLEKDDAVYSPCHRASLEFCSLAIEHKSTAPARRSSAMSRYADKPLKIRS